jgi:hypothetical protein
MVSSLSSSVLNLTGLTPQHRSETYFEGFGWNAEYPFAVGMKAFRPIKPSWLNMELTAEY